jgi:hypothetical protein
MGNMRVAYEIYRFKGESEISESGYVIQDESERFNEEEYGSEEEAMDALRGYFQDNENTDSEEFIVVKVFKK